MPLYSYQYLDSKGKKLAGIIEAQNDREAKDKLREQGLLIINVLLKSKGRGKQSLKKEALLTFTVQLSQLVSAGIPLYESLITIEEQIRKESFHRIILSICEQIKMGI